MEPTYELTRTDLIRIFGEWYQAGIDSNWPDFKAVDSDTYAKACADFLISRV